MTLSNKAIYKGIGEECKKCKNKMTRKQHPAHWKPKPGYYFSEWDHCEGCGHLQHYDKFKVKVETGELLHLF